jgi:peptide/nickel transport system ATP-binding protein
VAEPADVVEPVGVSEPASAAGPAGLGESGGLTVAGLRVSLAGTQLDVVSDISFQCGAGEAVGIVGESGSGKTTVGMALLGYVRPGMSISGGSAWVDGADVLALPPDEVVRTRGRRISYVPQEPAKALSPAMRIGRQIEEMLDGVTADKQVRSQRVAAAIEAAQLPADSDLLRRYPHQLSGGQQQRAAIAMALVAEPRVVVMDEPTTGLDVMVQARLLDVIRRIRSTTGVSVVYISHDLGVVRSIVDRVVVLYGGRIVEEGPVDEIFAAPTHPYTRRLIAAVPRVQGPRMRLRGIAGSAPQPWSRVPGCPFTPRCDLAIDRCGDEMPPVTSTGNGAVRCWRAFDPDPDLTASAPTLLQQASVSRPDSPALLTLTDLRAGYRRTISMLRGSKDTAAVAVDGVSLTIRESECVALVGESGSGKTTLARCVAGLHQPMSGAMTFAGTPVPADPRKRDPDLRRSIQIVFQDPDGSLNPKMAVSELIGRPVQRGSSLSPPQRAAEVARLLDQVHLPGSYLRRYPAELSGGEKQRVALARALAARPRLLVCDEVTSALDVAVQASILELLMELRATIGMAMLFISHDLAVVRAISDTVVVMRSGAVRECADTDDLFAAPADSYTSELIAAVPDLLPGDFSGFASSM